MNHLIVLTHKPPDEDILIGKPQMCTVPGHSCWPQNGPFDANLALLVSCNTSFIRSSTTHKTPESAEPFVFSLSFTKSASDSRAGDQTAKRDVTIARGQRTGCFIVYNHAESDRTLARMTHMLTVSIALCEQGRARVESQRCRENSWPGYASRNKRSSTTQIKARSSLSVSAAMYTCHSFGQELGPGTISVM